MRKLKVLLLAALLLVPVLAISGAAPVSASCTEGKIILYNGTNGSGQAASLCFPTDDPDLTLDDGPCGLFTTWNDCASSVTITGTSNYYVCLWTNTHYSGNGLRFTAPVTKYNLPSWMNNAASSIEWGANCLTD